MKNIILIISILLFLGCHETFHPAVKPSVKPGQRWVYSSQDPFYPLTHTNLILKVQGDYVQYQNQYGHIRSASILCFLIDSELIQKETKQ